uniref:Putative secreted protein n=1 Tax=Anopheles darlingi TaxID=43151 RepID=A0A2M4D9N6_ANODA
MPPGPFCVLAASLHMTCAVVQTVSEALPVVHLLDTAHRSCHSSYRIQWPTPSVATAALLVDQCPPVAGRYVPNESSYPVD